ncbi:MAG: anti-sigma factor family protein [Chloroflexota bacterium]
MRCPDVQAHLAAYLDGEVPPADSMSIQTHLAGCAACRQELTALATTQRGVGQALQRWAAAATPPPLAWGRLEARLAKEARPSPKWLPAQSAHPTQRLRLAPDAGRVVTLLFSGGAMRKGFLLATVLAVLALASAALFTATDVRPVSAREIIERSYAATMAADNRRGIRHLRSERYNNPQALSTDGATGQAESRNIVESFVDTLTGRFRVVVTDATTGRVMKVIGFDGTYSYTNNTSTPGGTGAPLTVYRLYQPNALTDAIFEPPVAPADEAQQLFEAVRQQSDTQLVGQETWPDGRQVYVLSFEVPFKGLKPVPAGKSMESLPQASSVWYFDTRTYRLLGSQYVVQRDGREIVAISHRELVWEILPAAAPVAWDLSDVPGITITDPPPGVRVDYLPEAISREALVSHTTSAYLLQTVPDGFAEEIRMTPGQPPGQPLVYAVAYRNEAGEYLLLQWGTSAPENWAQQVEEVYTTARGLTLHFLPARTAPGPGSAERTYSSVHVQAPDGSTFDLTSTLPRQRIKALAEALVPAK